MSLVLGLGLEHSCPWPRECLSSERLSLALALASDFFCVLGLGLEPCVLDSTSGMNTYQQSHSTASISTITNECNVDDAFCLQNEGDKFHTLCSSTEPYLCQNCYSELFSFQTLDNKQLLNEIRNDGKLNFDINHSNNSFFPAKYLQVDNKIKSLLNDLNSGLVDLKYCSQAEANITNKKCKFSLLCVNIRSLNANFDKLNELLQIMISYLISLL